MLTKDFFLLDPVSVAKNLVGQILVRNFNGQTMSILITETEAYDAFSDKACHAYKNKITNRTRVIFNDAGYIYVYLIYGMYFCFNIVTQKKGVGSCVLIRGGKIFCNEQLLSHFRYNLPFSSLSNYQLKNFLNGPGKLCKALNIDTSFNNKTIFTNELFLAKNTSFDPSTIKVGKRINIDYAEEAKDFLWRFYI